MRNIMQQINLYQIAETAEPKVLNFMQMAKVIVAIIMMLILINCFNLVVNNNAKKELVSLNNKQSLLNTALEQIKGQFLTEEDRKQLSQQIKDMEVIVTNMREMQFTLSHLKNGEIKGFSTFLTALAIHNVPELWLTAIKISSGGSAINLEGKTMTAENVPKFLQKIGQDKAFSGKTFETFKLSAEPKEKLISFTMGSE